jgi:aspartyl-tRNA(Asn)/glutamyl-tRNA(Gln) amidotransferase subunit A
MSLLREAERCLANQTSHAVLNAFITTLPAASGSSWLDRVKDADRRREQGTGTAE